MKLNGEFEIVKVGNEIVAVPVDEEETAPKGIAKLKNTTSKFIFEQFQDDISFGELMERCLKKYPHSTREEMEPAVKNYINALKKAGLLID